jgi:hypothetical protein
MSVFGQVVATGTSVLGRGKDYAEDRIKEATAYILGMQGYAYGFPLVMMDVTRGVMTATGTAGEYSAPINQFHRFRNFASPDFKNVVRVSRNSLWAVAFLDLDQEPIVFSHPDTKGRYLVAQAMNMWTDNFASIGSRTTGDGPGDFLIAGPRWEGTPPPDVTATYRCSTRYAWILVQPAAAGPQDFPEVHALQDALTLTPLSGWGTPYSPPDNVAVDATVDTTATPLDQVRLMDGPSFFARLATALQDNPAYPADAPMLRRLKRLGVEPGKDFDRRALDPATVKGLNRAVKKVWGMLESAPYGMDTVNGWILPLNLGRYGTDYNTRAFVAYVGLGALSAEDAIYPSGFVDIDGMPLDGAKSYVLHFEKDRLFPSLSGVWSISAYRENFYVHNPIERYAITSGMALTYNEDGSLDVYIQARSPGTDHEANWLPCPPSGPFNLSIRVYQPKQAMLDGGTKHNLVVEPGTYAIPPLVKVAAGRAIRGERRSASRTSGPAHPTGAPERRQRNAQMQARQDGAGS